MAESSSTEAPAETAPPTSASIQYNAPPRWRRITSTVLLVTFCLCSAFSVPAIWARNQVTNTDRYVRTVTPLASDPAIQNAVATKISTSLTQPIVSMTADALPGNQRVLTGPISTAMEGFVSDTVLEALQSDQFQQFWVDANRAIHSTVDAILAGDDTGVVQRGNGQLILDLTPVYTDVENRLQARGIDLSGRVQLDPSKTTFVLFESPELARVHRAVNLLEKAAILLPIAALIALAGYLFLARSRRSALIISGVGIAVAMAVLLLLLAIARWRYLEGLSPDRDQAAASAFFDILLRYFRDGARLLALVGLLVAGIAYATKPAGRVARVGGSARAWISSSWNNAAVKWPWLDSTAEGLARHRRELLAALLGLCCLILILRDRLTLGFVLVVAALGAIGFLVIRLVPRIESTRHPAETALAPAQQDAQEPTDAPVSTVAAPAVAAVTQPAAASTASTMPLELSEEDAQILRRLAALLREAPAEPAAS